MVNEQEKSTNKYEQTQTNSMKNDLKIYDFFKVNYEKNSKMNKNEHNFVT